MWPSNNPTNEGEQTIQDISDVNIIILIYLFIKLVLFILMYLYKCKMHVSRVESWSPNFRFSMSLSLSPNSLYRQTTDCTEGGGLTREHCTCKISRLSSRLYFSICQYFGGKVGGKNSYNVKCLYTMPLLSGHVSY